MGSLDIYNKKRDFSKTPEPPPKIAAKKKSKLTFCVQKHDATRLHYDFRLELDGVLKSWAVTKGPSLNPKDRRLAVRTEDHPLAYGGFEGIIPEGEYGGGTVMLWDRGIWDPVIDPHKGLKEGHLKFELHGERMKGKWALVLMKGDRYGAKHENWLLIKDNDEEADRTKKGEKFLDRNAFSVKSERKMEEIAKEQDKVWESNKKKTRKKTELKAKPSKPKSRAKAEKLAANYKGVELATLVTEPPSGKDWIHEIKFDGYRILCAVADGGVVIKTRNGHDWTDKFPSIAEALKSLKVKNAVIDGEAVVQDEKDLSHFGDLQEALGDGGDASRIIAYFFDLIHLNGKDISKESLLERKKKLQKLLKGQKKNSALQYSEHFESGENALQTACEQGLEGLISKYAHARYNPGRGKNWLKSKCSKRQEFVIIGYKPAKDNFRDIGALYLAYEKDGELTYAGKVGTGFNAKNAADTLKKLAPLKTAKAVIAVNAIDRKSAVWVEPEIMCEVTFTEWTSSGHIRHPSFEGLRFDKDAKQITKETPMKTAAAVKNQKKEAVKSKVAKNRKNEAFEVSGIIISHPEREIFKGTGITKGDLAEYYGMVAPYMMPSIKGYPISLLRCPSGTTGDCFFQRNPDAHMKKFVKPFNWKGGRGKSDHEYFYIENEKGLVSLIQMGVIEIHPWGSTHKAIDKPTRIIFDLDPAEDVDFEAVKLAALDIKKRLEKTGLKSFLKVSGGKGLHIVVPIAPKYDWDTVKEWAGEFSRNIAAEVPEAYVATMTKKKRSGKIFIDFFRNDYTATAIADYAVRAREGGPVALPIEWSELKGLKSANQFKMKDVLTRIKKKKPDLKRYNLKQNLPKSL